MYQVLAAHNGYIVCFVQVTIAKTHFFKENYFTGVLLVLSKVVTIEVKLVKVEAVDSICTKFLLLIMGTLLVLYK
jgi:hypothetical protein